MSREFRMPSLGADMESGKLVEWRIAPGTQVKRGDIVALVETDKGIIDIESFDDGVVERLVVTPGTTVPVGTVLALLSGEPQQQQRAVRASPAARAKAREAGIDLAQVVASGADGAITLQDVERAAGGAAPARTGMRDTIAQAMSRSKREIPHYYAQLAIDFSTAARWLAQNNERRPITERMLPAVLLIKAVARAASIEPGFSGYYEGNRFQRSESVHVGVAIALRGGGVVAPALLDAAAKPLDALMGELRGLVERARGGHLRSGELASATLTVTSLGDEGVDVIQPVIYPPQVAIVGFGSILARPWAEQEKVVVRPVVIATLAADHRVTDGRQGARLLARIRDLLARPEEL